MGEKRMIGVNIRKASRQDVPTLVELRIKQLNDEDHYQTVDIQANLTHYFSESLENGSFISWVAEIDQKIIATSGVCFSAVPPHFGNRDGRIATIANMYTAPQFRRQGIAITLLGKVVDEARHRGFEVIRVNASKYGKPMYEKFGFKEKKNALEYLSNE